MAINTEGLVPARLGDSGKLEIGDFVLAVGSPFGLSHSVTYGIISAKGRRDLRLGDDGVQYQDFLQTDAAINPGNSGGPLLNLRGEVIGLTTAIASSSGANEGIGFAIPINMAMVIADQLVERGLVVRAFLGVKLDASFGPAEAARLGMARPQGARVTGITRNSPAELARIQVGDVILEFDGSRVEDDMHLINLVSLTPVQKEVDVRLLREGRPVHLRVRVANRSQMPPE
jgi:serine protease Do